MEVREIRCLVGRLALLELLNLSEKIAVLFKKRHVVSRNRSAIQQTRYLLTIQEIMPREQLLLLGCEGFISDLLEDSIYFRLENCSLRLDVAFQKPILLEQRVENFMIT